FIRPTGQYDTVQALADTLIDVDGQVVRLGDIVQIVRGYEDPPATQMRYQGEPVLGIGSTAADGYDVVRLGDDLDAVVGRLRGELPAGLKLDEVASMPHAVSASVDEFLRAVGEAVAIVLIVSLVSLGLRTGL